MPCCDTLLTTELRTPVRRARSGLPEALFAKYDANKDAVLDKKEVGRSTSNRNLQNLKLPNPKP